LAEKHGNSDMKTYAKLCMVINTWKCLAKAKGQIFSKSYNVDCSGGKLKFERKCEICEMPLPNERKMYFYREHRLSHLNEEDKSS